MTARQDGMTSGRLASTTSALAAAMIGGAIVFGAQGAFASGPAAQAEAAEQGVQDVQQGVQMAAGTMDEMSPTNSADEVAEANGSAGPLLALPVMDPARGRKLFASKGCVVCHSVNGVGGEDAPPFDMTEMPGRYMNPFDFAARMWRGAETMIAMQNEELGHQIELNGQELADIIAFAHDPKEQKKFSAADIPAQVKDWIAHLENGDSDEHVVTE